MDELKSVVGRYLGSTDGDEDDEIESGTLKEAAEQPATYWQGTG
jgi:hypothetical protein